MTDVSKSIQVLGSGCVTCKKLYEITKKVVLDMGVKVEVEYVTDIQKIIEMGVMQSPLIAVNGKPVILGFTSDVERIKKAIQDNL